MNILYYEISQNHFDIYIDEESEGLLNEVSPKFDVN